MFTRCYSFEQPGNISRGCPWQNVLLGTVAEFLICNLAAAASRPKAGSSGLRNRRTDPNNVSCSASKLLTPLPPTAADNASPPGAGESLAAQAAGGPTSTSLGDLSCHAAQDTVATDSWTTQHPPCNLLPLEPTEYLCRCALSIRVASTLSASPHPGTPGNHPLHAREWRFTLT